MPLICPPEKRPLNLLRFERALQFRRIDRVVFNGVAGPHHLRVLQSRNRLNNRKLHVDRQRGAHAIDVNLVRVQPLGFEEKLVRYLVGKFYDFVFDRRAIARPNGLNLSAVHRRTMHILADDAMRLFGRERDVAGHLRVVMRDALGAKAEWRWIDVARLHLKARPVDGASIEPRRRAGLQPATAQSKILQRFAE